ncbi:DUF1653 domain-containing protein [Motilimonas pumila]|uniref:DUF1653 domain-containing protein n=1 Tax=Motilimonas pumila TaxID=2303987 RepID=A0A418YHA3_9GAMM|nr:DUF1653 domain-containing protein [Motilimonas pumila]RJG49481.1 DUF1653 domain-containing protein [Motilimonas pumila]
MKPPFTPGKYQHYKGNFYQVIDLACHSESEQWHVVYRPLYGSGDLWVRPYDMFFEAVITPQGKLPRFTLITPSE